MAGSTIGGTNPLWVCGSCPLEELTPGGTACNSINVLSMLARVVGVSVGVEVIPLE